MLPAKIDFVCLKWGTKYTSEFVNKLDNMISRNVSVPYQLHCMTEDPTGIKPTIEIIPLPDLYVTHHFVIMIELFKTNKSSFHK